MGAHAREQIIALGITAQTDIDTANDVGDMVRLTKTNLPPADLQLVTENDGGEVGKGSEFPETIFPSHWDGGFTLEKYVTSQMIALCGYLALGNRAKVGIADPWEYTSVEQDPIADGIELPYVSYLQQVRPGGSPVFDELLIGNVLNSFQVQLGSGPGRDNAKLIMEFLASGKQTVPSGLTAPALLTETFLPQGSTLATINGVDYVTNKNLLSLTWGWNNGITGDSGFFIGSGTQDGASKKGRFEFFNRQPILNFVARMAEGSDEYTKLKSGTTGTAVISQSNGDNDYTVTFQKVGFSVVERGEQDGLLVVNVTALPMRHTSNGVIEIVTNTDLDGIGD